MCEQHAVATTQTHPVSSKMVCRPSVSRHALCILHDRACKKQSAFDDIDSKH